MSWPFIITVSLLFVLLISLLAALYLIFCEKISTRDRLHEIEKLLRENEQLRDEAEKSKKAPQKSIDCQRMLHDMLNGGAVLHVEVIDPSSIYVHRS